MIRLRGHEDKTVIEMDPATKVQLIDGLHYVETNEVRRIGALTELCALRAFEMVEVLTGFEDDETPSLMTILPKKRNGFAAMVASLVLAMCAVGCGPAAYSYTYTCYGQGCVQPMPQAYAPMYYQQAVPQPVYVDRPMEIRVNDDGSSYVQRRPAQPTIR